MLAFVQLLGTLVANLFRSQRLEVENLFLRHQLNAISSNELALFERNQLLVVTENLPRFGDCVGE